MTKLLITFLLTLIVLAAFPYWSPAQAALCQGLTFPGGETILGPVTNCSLNTPAGFISGFLLPIITIAGFLTVIFIVISGIQFILSSGNPEAAAGAKNRLIFALVGFALIILAFAILQIVNRLFLGPTGVA